MKPAAVLIGTLEVQLGRPSELGMGFQHGGVTATGVEPHVEGVGLLLEPVAPALGAARAGGHKVGL